MGKIIKRALAMLTLSITPAAASFELPEGFVSVIDVNGTVILQDSSTGKDLEAARNQVVASQLTANGTTVERFIKDAFPSKDLQHSIYRNLPEHLDCWVGQSLFPVNIRGDFVALNKKAMAALKESDQFKGLFPSIIHYIQTLLTHDPNARFILHSFGSDTDHAMEAISSAVPGLIVHEARGAFDEEGHLVHGDAVYREPTELKGLLEPGLHVWQANHVGWKKGTGGKVVWEGSSILFDDNADICSRPIVRGVYDQAAASSMEGREIQLVDTFKALTDKEYYLKLLQKAYPRGQ